MDGFILGGKKSFHAFHNRTHMASSCIPSGKWFLLFVMSRLSCVLGGAAVQTCCQAWPEKCISVQRAFAFGSMIAVCPVFPSIFSIFKPLQLSATCKASGILAGDRCCRQTVNKFFTFPSAVPKHNFFYVVVTEARLHVRAQIMRYHTVRPKC